MRASLFLWIFSVWTGSLLTATSLAQSSTTDKPPQFEDIAQKAGLTVAHISSPDKKYIVESMSGGVGLIDCDNDGKLDIITVNGSTVERYKQGGDPMITLYHQETILRLSKFTDITKSAGLTRKGWGMGVAVADYDNDGLQDIYVTGYGGNALYHNLGNCKFEDVTEKAGVGAGGFSTGAAWADYDRDGRVDLFVSRYVHVDIDNLPQFGNDPRISAASRESWCSAVRGACPANPICCFTIKATAPSKKFRRKRASTIRTTITAWARPGAITITTAGPISMWQTTPDRISSITTSTMEPSKMSACSTESR